MVKKLILIWLISLISLFSVTVAAAQKMTIATSKQTPKLAMVGFSIDRFPKIDRHPTEVFREQFMIGWIMADWWQGVFEKLSTGDKNRLLDWMNKESKVMIRERNTIWRQLEKQFHQGLIKWLINDLSDALVNSFIRVQYDDVTTSQIAVPIIDYYQCQVADLMCLEYLCRYKAAKGSFIYRRDWFKVADRPIPGEILVLISRTHAN